MAISPRVLSHLSCALLSGLTLLGVTGGSKAQSVNRMQTMRDAHGIASTPAGDIAIGATYVVEFDPRGFAYTAVLGARAQRSHRLRLAAAELRRGDRVVELANPAAPARADAFTVERRLADGITQIHRAERDGFAFSFAFDRVPEGSGDLTVRMHLESTLAEWKSDERGLHASEPGVGGIDIGNVTGIDAEGKRVSGAMRLDGRWLELSLPAAFVDGACAPLVLDPLIGTSSVVSDGTSNDTEPAVAYDAATDRFLVAWSRVVSNVDRDLIGQLVDGDGGLVGGPLAIDVSSGIARTPCVAGAGQFALAWQVSGSPFGPWTLLFCKVDPSGTVSPATFTPSGDNTSPTAWAALSPGIVRLLWIRDGSSIVAGTLSLQQPISAPPSLSGVHEFAFENNGVVAVAIAPAPAAGSHNVVAWSNGGTVLARLVDAFLQPLAPVTVVATAARCDAVAVDGRGSGFAIAYSRFEGVTTDPPDRKSVV